MCWLLSTIFEGLVGTPMMKVRYLTVFLAEFSRFQSVLQHIVWCQLHMLSAAPALYRRTRSMEVLILTVHVWLQFG